MLQNIFALALYALTITTAAAYRTSSQAPECVAKCWSNSQYVSTCLGDTNCLCDDTEFQSVVYQCLYSQCSTSKFGVALHHALSYCSGQQQAALLPSPASPHLQESPVPTAAPQPALLRQDTLNKRAGGVDYERNTNSVTRSVTRTRQSVSASAYMTYATQRAIVTPLPNGHLENPFILPRALDLEPEAARPDL